MSELTSEQQHTRLRIVGKPKDALTRNILVYDADTGDQVANICKIVLTLDAYNKINYADVTYYPEKGEEQVMTLKDSEVDVTAYVGSEHSEATQWGPTPKDASGKGWIIE